MFPIVCKSANRQERVSRDYVRPSVPGQVIVFVFQLSLFLRGKRDLFCLALYPDSSMSMIRKQERATWSSNQKDASFTLDIRRLYMGGSGASIVFVEDSQVDHYA